MIAEKEILDYLDGDVGRLSAETIAKVIGYPAFLITNTLDYLVRDNKLNCSTVGTQRVYYPRTQKSRQTELDIAVDNIEATRRPGHTPIDQSAMIDVPPEVATLDVPSTKWEPTSNPWSIVGSEMELPFARQWIIEALGWEYEIKENDGSGRPCDSVIRWLGGKSKLLPWLIERFPAHHGWVDVFSGSLKVTLGKPQAPVEIINDRYSALINFWRVASQWPELLADAINNIPSSRTIHRLFQRDMHRDRTGFDAVDAFRRAVMFGYVSVHGFNGLTWKGYGANMLSPTGKIDKDVMIAMAGRLSGRGVMIENLDFREVIRRYSLKKPQQGVVLTYLDPPYYKTEGYKNSFPDEWHMELADLMVEIHESGNLFLMTNSSHAEAPYKARWRGVTAASAFRTEKVNVKYTVGSGWSEDATDQDQEIVFANFDLSGRQGGLFK
jgi:DNA adenine methylase